MSRPSTPRRPLARVHGSLLFVVLLAGALALALTGCGAPAGAAPGRPTAAPTTAPTVAPTTPPAPQPAQAPPDGQTYFGVHLDWAVDTPAAYTARLGKAPMVYGVFAPFPLSAGDAASLSQKVDLIKAAHGKLLLTLMPNDGLGVVTEASAADLATILAGYNARAAWTSTSASRTR